MKHQFLTTHTCNCKQCVSETADCIICGGSDATLTTDCCGQRVPEHYLDSVAGNFLDFTTARGWFSPQWEAHREATLRKIYEETE